MQSVDRIYIDGELIVPHGDEIVEIINPATEEVIGSVRLADEVDARDAIAAAKHAFTSFSKSTKEERIALLKRMGAAIAARSADLKQAMIEEYGASQMFVAMSIHRAATICDDMANTLATYDLIRPNGRTAVSMRPVGVAAAITPWNANYAFVTTKLATAIAAGCTIVVKPSEFSAIQTRLLTECLHQAEAPPGVINIVTGRGSVVGNVLTSHPDVSKVSFTGSTDVGRQVLHNCAETMKRATLELGGKGPTIILEDANVEAIIPSVLMAGFVNNGQACFAGTRILAPLSRLDEILSAIKHNVSGIVVGDARNPATVIGPLVNRKQFDRVQGYVRLGIEEGADVLIGGLGRPDGLDKGWFVKPTVFSGVSNDMRIAREEIFGPVLCVIPYRDEAEAVAIANDTKYGLRANIFSDDISRAQRMADQLEYGTILLNGAPHDPAAPFGGVKQSGMGREYGAIGLEAYLEPCAVTA